MNIWYVNVFMVFVEFHWYQFGQETVSTLEFAARCTLPSIPAILWSGSALRDMDQIGSDPSRRGKLVKTSAVKNEQSKAGQRPSETVRDRRLRRLRRLIVECLWKFTQSWPIVDFAFCVVLQLFCKLTCSNGSVNQVFPSHTFLLWQFLSTKVKLSLFIGWKTTRAKKCAKPSVGLFFWKFSCCVPWNGGCGHASLREDMASTVALSGI